jgi:long-subunit acyl-CoA synthetase (AMP-forming)
MVLHNIKAAFANSIAAVNRLGLTGQDRALIPVPVNHLFSFGAALLPSLLVGATIRLPARGNPLVIFQAQRSFEPTVMFMVPSQNRSIVALGLKASSLG